MCIGRNEHRMEKCLAALHRQPSSVEDFPIKYGFIFDTKWKWPYCTESGPKPMMFCSQSQYICSMYYAWLVLCGLFWPFLFRFADEVVFYSEWSSFWHVITVCVEIMDSYTHRTRPHAVCRMIFRQLSFYGLIIGKRWRWKIWCAICVCVCKLHHSCTLFHLITTLYGSAPYVAGPILMHKQNRIVLRLYIFIYSGKYACMELLQPYRVPKNKSLLQARGTKNERIVRRPQWKRETIGEWEPEWMIFNQYNLLTYYFCRRRI